MKIHTVIETILKWADNTKSLVVPFFDSNTFSQTFETHILQLKLFIGSLLVFFPFQSCCCSCRYHCSDHFLEVHFRFTRTLPHLWASLDNTSLPKLLCHLGFTTCFTLPGLTLCWQLISYNSAHTG